MIQIRHSSAHYRIHMTKMIPPATTVQNPMERARERRVCRDTMINHLLWFFRAKEQYNGA